MHVEWTPALVDCVKAWGSILFIYAAASLFFGLLWASPLHPTPRWARPGLVLVAVGMLVAFGFLVVEVLPTLFVPLWHLVVK